MPLQRVPINNFRGGLNTRDGPFDLQPNESPDLLNVTLTALVGQLRMRDGKTRFDTAGMPAFNADNLQQVVLGTSTRLLMASIHGSVYNVSSGGVVSAALFTGTVGTVWSFAQFVDSSGNDRVYMQNGVDPPQKWDGAAGATSAWTATVGAIPNGGVLRVWRNRLCVAGVAGNTQRLYLSKFSDADAATGAYDFLDMRGPDDEQAAITEINVLGDRLYVFKNRSVWVIADPSTLANRKLGQPGCTARFQSDVCEDKLYWFNEQGLWSTAGVAVALETGAITNYFPNNMNEAQTSKVRVIGTRDSYPRVLIALPVAGSLTNNILIELIPHINFRRIGGRRYLLLPAFMLHSLDCVSLCNYKSSNLWGIFAGSSNNRIHQLFVPGATTDDGTAIIAHWKSSWMAIQGEEPFERIRRLNVELSGEVIVDVFKDFNTTPDFSKSLIDPGRGTTADNFWDGPPGVWDGGTWDPVSLYRFARVRPESRGRFHQVQFRSLPSGEPFLINVAELAIRGGKEH